MNDKVSVGVSANPDQVLAAFKKIEGAAKAAGREIKGMTDIHFPGLEEAEKTLRDFQRGFDQMLSSAVSGRAAQALRSGVHAGMYSRDPVSWFMNSGRQFPDDRAHQQHVQSVLQQSAALARFSPAGGGGGGGGDGGGFGLGGMMTMARSLLPLLGIGTGLGYLFKKAGDGGQQAAAVSDLRRSVRGVDEEFDAFRDNVRKAGDGLGVAYTETVKLAQEYARLAGSMGSSQTSAGAHEGIALARLFGMDPSRGVSMLGRASLLNVGGGSPADQAKLLAEAMVRSNLGGRQSEAAEAMIRFAERNGQMTGDAGNMRGFMEEFSKLTNHGSAGLRANAEGLLGGYDAAIRRGGNAGDAGKAFIYNVLSEMGIKGPFRAQMAMERGYNADLGGGRQLGPELIRRIMAMPGSEDMAAARMSGLFGNSMNNASRVIDAFKKADGDVNNKDYKAEVERVLEDMKKDDPGQQWRQAGSAMANALDKLLSDNLFKPIVEIKDGVTNIARFTEALARKAGFVDQGADTLNKSNALLSPVTAPLAAYSAMQRMLGKKVDVSGSPAGDGAWMAQLRNYESELGIPGLLWGILGNESSFGRNKNVGKNGIFQLTGVAQRDIKDKTGFDVDPSDKDSALKGAYLYTRLKRDELVARGVTPSLENVALAYRNGTGGMLSGDMIEPGYGAKAARNAGYSPAGVPTVHVSVAASVEGELKDSQGKSVGTTRLRIGRISPPSAVTVGGAN